MSKTSQDMRVKAVFIGDSGVGKTTYINRIITGDFEKKHIGTVGADVHPIEFNTEKGKVIFDVWDTAGQERYCGIPSAYYINADVCFVMFDITSVESFNSINKWISNFRKTSDAPIILLGNKVDSTDVKVKQSTIKQQNITQLPYFNISVKSNYNFEKPFAYFIKEKFNTKIIY